LREYTEVDDGRWILTDALLADPPAYRRLVRTQIEELYAVYSLYELPELDGIRHRLDQLRQEYSDAEPFNRLLLADPERGLDDEDG
jgi:hypothetical protein